ncbi:MAG: 1,2-phenylacetyl-CoA epoxidase subunit PaaD [Granulosicoccus sp.]
MSIVQAPTNDIWNWLEAVPDPEIPVISVVDLGVIRDIEWQLDVLEVTITPTYSGCPAMAVITQDIEHELKLRGIEKILIKRQIAPAWTTDWLSEKGKQSLEDYGIAPPRVAGVPERCPQCKSGNVEKVSQFGSTPCKALWRCKSCLEPFDYFKCI